MPHFFRLLTALFLTGFSISCSTMSVHADHDSEVDFTAYSSFAIFERPGKEGRRPQMSELVDRRIASSTTSEIQSRGFSQSSPNSADFLVTFHTAVRQRVVVNRSGWYGRGRWGWSGGTRRVSTFPEGTLVIDIIDRRQRELVWRGVGETAFTTANPSDERVAQRVARILRDIPPTE